MFRYVVIGLLLMEGVAVGGKGYCWCIGGKVLFCEAFSPFLCLSLVAFWDQGQDPQCAS